MPQRGREDGGVERGLGNSLIRKLVVHIERSVSGKCSGNDREALSPA